MPPQELYDAIIGKQQIFQFFFYKKALQTVIYQGKFTK